MLIILVLKRFLISVRLCATAGLSDKMSVDYTITYHRNMHEPIVYIKNRFIAARQLVEKLMIGLEPSEKIVIERKRK